MNLKPSDARSWKRRLASRLRRYLERGLKIWPRWPVARWIVLPGVLSLWAFVAVGLTELEFSWVPLDLAWHVKVAVASIALALGAVLVVLWQARLEPLKNSRSQYAPQMWRLNFAIGLALLGATAFEYALFGSLGGNWSWPWNQVRLLGSATDTSFIQSALALVTPYIALITAVFAYRRTRLSLADSERSDAAAFQQRYIDAAKLLAEESSTARVAGAIAMGSLARDWVANRQECVNVICGYLRVKPAPSHLTRDESKDVSERYDWHNGEDNVRRQLVDELRLALGGHGSDLPHYERQIKIDVNLAGALFAPNTRLSGAIFMGNASFDGAIFTGDASFDGATFTWDASFDGATFTRDASFDGATFTWDTSFVEATFTRDASFDGATFTWDISFAEATFTWDTSFAEATFTRDTSFDGATFTRDASFDGATFTRDASFDGATFTSNYETFPAGIQPRGPLGPLAKASSIPDPPGNIVDDDSKQERDAEWYLEGEVRPDQN